MWCMYLLFDYVTGINAQINSINFKPMKIENRIVTKLCSFLVDGTCSMQLLSHNNHFHCRKLYCTVIC